MKNVPKRAVRRFVEVVGDKPLAETTREDTVRLAEADHPDDDTEPLHPSSGNREIGELRKLYREYFSFEHNDKERPNPFRSLCFPEDDSAIRALLP